MIKNQNPVFSKIEVGTTHYQDVDAASYKGITIKTALLLGVTVLVGIITAYLLPTILANNPAGLYVALVVSSIVGFIAILVGRLSSRASKYAGVIYSACQGLFLGTLTAIAEAYFEGIGSLAIFSTLIIFGTMLVLYAVGVLRKGNFFRKMAYGMTFGAMILLIFTSIFGLFMPSIYSNLPLMIGLEAFFLIYGVVTLIFNFDEATYVVESGCTKDAEWNVSLGLTVSILYIYVEILRLLILIFMNNDN